MAITTQLVGKLGGGFKPEQGFPLRISDRNTRAITPSSKRTVILVKWSREASLAKIIFNGVTYDTPGLIVITVPAGTSVRYGVQNQNFPITIEGIWVADVPDGV